MDIIKRNFLKIITSGAFDKKMPVESMSNYKWQKLEQLVDFCHLEQYSSKGVEICSDEVPSWIYDDMININYVDYYKDIENQQLSNKWLNHRLNSIRTNERHAIDASMESVRLLNIIVANVNNILKSGVSLKLVLMLGTFLRDKGSRVDFVKTDRWLKKLHIRNMSELLGSILITVFDFDKDEIPFVEKVQTISYNLTTKSLNLHYTVNPEWHFRQERNGIVLNTSPTATRSISRCLAFITYAPIESISIFLVGLARGLSEIEE